MTAPTTASLGVAADVYRLVGKPEKFSNDKAAFPRWSFVMVSYISAMSGDQSDRIILVGFAADSRPYAAQLFHVVTMLSKDEALQAIMGIENGNGLEAWRQLKRDNRPRSNAANRGRLHRVTKPEHIVSTTTSVRGRMRKMGKRGQRVRGDLGRRCAGVHSHGRVAGRLGRSAASTASHHQCDADA